ncbi:MAG TPA: hypothetical protein PLP42_02730 [Acidobacteriota bacterium]|jgi:hypothetical protein|nr:hypothetical protein [Acidobacteriota bacterium]
MRLFDLKCTSCGSRRISASAIETRAGKVLSWFALRRLRCTFCGKNLYRFTRKCPTVLGFQNPLVRLNSVPTDTNSFRHIVQEIARLEAQLQSECRLTIEKGIRQVGQVVEEPEESALPLRLKTGSDN